MQVDPRFLTSQGPEVFNGNELLLKGALETQGGVHLLGGYPGSPVAAYFDAMTHIKDLLSGHGVYAVMNSNEALAAAMLNGSQVIGCRAMIAMKSVGVHVAADALALGNLAGAHEEGGAIVVYGDDPWSDSTQVAADSRFISKHLFIPVVEPANAQEVKDYVDLSFKLSRRSELYVGYILPTNLADGGGSVQCRPNQFPAFSTRQRKTLDTSALDLNKFVLLPPKTWWQEEKLAPRFARAVQAARDLGLNRIEHADGGKEKPLGFIASGMAYAYLQQALWEMGLLGEFPILKFALSYPVDEELVRQLATQCRQIVVVEERRSFLEEQVAQTLLADRQAGKPTGRTELWGKQFPDGLSGIPATRGLHPSILIERLAPLLNRVAKGSAGIQSAHRELKTIDSTSQTDVGALPARTATFCPGCPHRDSADLCLEIKKRFMDPGYMRRRYSRKPMDLMFHGDTGCYTMLMFPPTTPLMHDYSGMGLGGGTGTGTDPFITNKQVVFMGDGTFFHSGQLAISQAVKLGQDITFIILDNSTTGMTGHQPTSGVSYDIIGNPTAVQDIEEIVLGMVGNSNLSVVRADPAQRTRYRDLLERTFLADGVKVVIATKECGITRMRRQRRSERAIARRLGFLPRWEHMNVNQEICRFCLACAEYTGCPGLKHTSTDYGMKMDTDVSWCVNDGACERIGACSAFEHVTIKRKRPPRSRLPELGLDEIPEPAQRPAGEVWRCCLTGVGGMGIGVATSILVRAGHKQGYEVIFLDKKGLAIRNGGVVSQVVYNITHQPLSAVIPYGKADLLLGVDILEAARTLDPRGRSRIASSDLTAAVINTDKIQTIRSLMGLEDYDPAKLEELIRRHTRSDDFLARNIARICEKYLGSKLYSNIMMLGFAFQKGLIPVSMHSMAWAIKDTIRTDFRKNLYAFNMGRKLVVQPELFQGPAPRDDWRDVLEEKCRCLIRRHGRAGEKLAGQFRQTVSSAVGAMDKLDGATQRAFVVRAYDCLRWGGPEYAGQYAQAVTGTYSRELPGQAHAATDAVVYNLADAMLIKDGPFIAELATSPEKYARDREKYNVNPANGDRIVYRHLLHPTFRLGPWTFDAGFTVSPAALRLVRRMRWLRKLPAWHKRERLFLEQYLERVRTFTPRDEQQYRQALRGLSSPRCMNCMNPRCQEQGCPMAVHVPQCSQLVYEGRWREAAETLLEANNFPEFTSIVCPAFCEEACKRELSGYNVEFKGVERRIIDHAFEQGWITPQPALRKTGRKAAVVGAGPAGLAAAQQLARAGHDVTVFEKDPLVGGLLRYGIPSHRLDRALIDRRIRQLTAEGVTFRASTAVGRDVAADALRREFDAVLLAVGAGKSRELNIPGRNLTGVHYAIDLLRQAAGAGQSAAVDVRDKVVVVIGGGLTGEDAVETALSMGARKVHQFEILAAPARTSDDAVADDRVERRYCVATRAFEGSNGAVESLRGVEVRWTPSANGPVMRDLPDSEFTLKADVVLLAMGFQPSIDAGIIAQLGLTADAAGRPNVREHASNVEGVFAAGDVVAGASYVATAIDSGRQAAAKINAYLSR